MVEFREHNLMNAVQLPKPMDLILLRNALIYMVDEARLHILRGIGTQLHAQGYLVLGASETVFDLDVALDSVAVGLARYYRVSASP
jgi:chemotaxis methyl-accepting protein methylase